MSISKPIPFMPEGPQPLFRPISIGQSYPVSALGPFRSAVEAVQGMTVAPIALPAQSALSIASLAVQGFGDVETLGGTSPTSLYCLTIAKSGERKSSCDAPFMDAIRSFEATAARERFDELAVWENDRALWKNQHQHILSVAKRDKGKSREGAKAELVALGPEPTAPLLPDRTVSEPTFEGLTRLFATGQPSLGIFSDEGGQFLGGFAMSSDNRQKTLAALNDLWHGNPIRRTRAGDGHSALLGRRLAIHLMIQPSVAADFMADPKTLDTGFLPRFLICQPASAIGTRLYGLSREDAGGLASFKDRMMAILKTAMKMNEKTGELQMATLGLSAEARSLLIGFHDQTERSQIYGGDLADVTGFASKAAEQAARIAGVMTLWCNLKAKSVQASDMANAIELSRFYLSEASRLESASCVSKDTDNAEKLRIWLVETWQHAEITTREVVQKGPNSLRISKKARAALCLLEEFGWLQRLPSQIAIRGRSRKEAWQIVRGG